MQSIIQLFLPLFAYFVQLAAQIGLRMLPAVKDDIAKMTEKSFEIIFACLTGQITSDEEKMSFRILVDDLKAMGETLLGKLQIEEMRLPAELLAGFSSVVGSLPGALLKLI